MSRDCHHAYTGPVFDDETACVRIMDAPSRDLEVSFKAPLGGFDQPADDFALSLIAHLVGPRKGKRRTPRPKRSRAMTKRYLANSTPKAVREYRQSALAQFVEGS